MRVSSELGFALYDENDTTFELSNLVPDKKVLDSALMKINLKENSISVSEMNAVLLHNEQKISNHLELNKKFQQRLNEVMRQKIDLEKRVLSLESLLSLKNKKNKKNEHGHLTMDVQGQSEKKEEGISCITKKDGCSQTETAFEEKSCEERNDHFSPLSKSQKRPQITVSEEKLCEERNGKSLQSSRPQKRPQNFEWKNTEFESSIIIQGLLNHDSAFFEDRMETKLETFTLIRKLCETLSLDFDHMIKRCYRYPGIRPTICPFPTSVFVQFTDTYQRKRFTDRLAILRGGFYGHSKLRVYPFIPSQLRHKYRNLQSVSYNLRKIAGIKKVQICLEGQQLNLYFEENGIWQVYDNI